jgi:hypothetical protein
LRPWRPILAQGQSPSQSYPVRFSPHSTWRLGVEIYQRTLLDGLCFRQYEVFARHSSGYHKIYEAPSVSGASLQQLVLLCGQHFFAVGDSHGRKKALQSTSKGMRYSFKRSNGFPKFYSHVTCCCYGTWPVPLSAPTIYGVVYAFTEQLWILAVSYNHGKIVISKSDAKSWAIDPVLKLSAVVHTQRGTTPDSCLQQKIQVQVQPKHCFGISLFQQ